MGIVQFAIFIVVALLVGSIPMLGFSFVMAKCYRRKARKERKNVVWLVIKSDDWMKAAKGFADVALASGVALVVCMACLAF